MVSEPVVENGDETFPLRVLLVNTRRLLRFLPTFFHFNIALLLRRRRLRIFLGFRFPTSLLRPRSSGSSARCRCLRRHCCCFVALHFPLSFFQFLFFGLCFQCLYISLSSALQIQTKQPPFTISTLDIIPEPEKTDLNPTQKT